MKPPSGPSFANGNLIPDFETGKGDLLVVPAHAGWKDAEGAQLPIALCGGVTTEDAKNAFFRYPVKAWWCDMVWKGSRKGAHFIGLMPPFFTSKGALYPDEWERRFFGVLVTQRHAGAPHDPGLVEKSLRNLRAWSDNVGTVERIFVSLRGTVPLGQLRSALDRNLDPRFRIYI